MKMHCEQCGYTGEKINFMKLNTETKTLTYVDICPECGSQGPFAPYEEETGELHDEAQAVADRIFQEHSESVSQYEVSKDTLISDEELKNLNMDDKD